MTTSQDDTSMAGETVDIPLVLTLQQIGRRDLAVAGGKGANLGELVRARFPVPPGFVATTAAYDRFVAHNGLDAAIATMLQAGQGDGSRLRETFQRGVAPPDVRTAVQQAYLRLGQGPVAVRSSATAEDLPDAAFAGQQDTFLNINGEAELLDAVRRCWASLWTDRAIAYRQRQGLDQQTVKLAVVVQQMVAAEVAGVMFTANPVTGARNETVIDASPGLGEAVVSGMATPDHFVLRKRLIAWRVVQRSLGRQEVIVRAGAHGGVEHIEGAPVGEVQVLPDRVLRQLVRLGAAIQQHFGSPQDIEWAWAGGRPYILQTRPITALPEPLTRASRLVSRAAPVLELLVVRPYPLDITAWVPAVFGAISPMFEAVGFAMEPMERIFSEEDGVTVRFVGRLPVRPTVRVLLAPVWLLALSRRYDPLRWQADSDLNAGLSRAYALNKRDFHDQSWDSLAATLREALALPRLLAGETRRRYILGAALAAGRLWLMLGVLGRRDRFGVLLSGVDNKTLEANRTLEELATRVRADPALTGIFASHDARQLWAALEAHPAGRKFLDELRTFLDRYGHRESLIMLASLPTWKDAPEVVLGVIKGSMGAAPRAQPDQPEWEIARDDLLAHPLLRLPPARAAFLAALAQARCLLQIREDTHFYATLAMPVVRRTWLEMGRRLVGMGVLDVPEDIFHLKLHELLQAGEAPPPLRVRELRALIARRKERRAALEGTPLVDPRLLYRPALVSPEMESRVLLRGMPGSPGVAEGVVCVVHSSAEFGKLRPGEVLVAPYTNPAWTPLFQHAAAVVVDTGGMASHAAIVAREYGVPAVMGTVEATRLLVDGQRVRVDGNRGLVLKPASDGN